MFCLLNLQCNVLLTCILGDSRASCIHFKQEENRVWLIGRCQRYFFYWGISS